MNTGYLLMNISKKLKYDLNQALIEKGITVQQWAVIQQTHQNEQITAKELAYALDMDNPTVSGIVHRLEKKDLLFKKPNPSDKRSSLLLLTKTGNNILHECQTISDRILEQYTSALSQSELKMLNQLLTKMNQEERKI